MKTLRQGDTGADVKDLQAALNVHGFALTPDGDFGPKTLAAVEDFQESAGLYADGIVGARTWAALNGEALPESNVEDWVRVDADRFKEGYNNFKLRTDVAKRYNMVRELVVAAGGIIPSSGGRRRLTAKVHANRSATSLHYIGRALDLYVYGGMVDPHTDPLVICIDIDEPRGWIVYVRADGGEEMTLNAYTYQMKEVQTSGRFLNLTAIFAQHGFYGIRARKSFFKSGPNENNGAAEWWHFQDETGLDRGVTTFGSELLRLYTSAVLIGTPPWKYRERTFKDGWF